MRRVIQFNRESTKDNEYVMHKKILQSDDQQIKGK